MGQVKPGAGVNNASLLPPPSSAMKQAKATDQAKFSRSDDKQASGEQALNGDDDDE